MDDECEDSGILKKEKEANEKANVISY